MLKSDNVTLNSLNHFFYVSVRDCLIYLTNNPTQKPQEITLFQTITSYLLRLYINIYTWKLIGDIFQFGQIPQ